LILKDILESGEVKR